MTSHPTYLSPLGCGVGIGIAVSFKRLWLGLFLGRKTYRNYAEDLARVMQKIFLLSKIAILARHLAHKVARKQRSFHGPPYMTNLGLSRDKYAGLLRAHSEENLAAAAATAAANAEALEKKRFASMGESVPSMLRAEEPAPTLPTGRIIESDDPDDRRVLTQAEKRRIEELLGAWEEPDRELGVEEDVSINAILQFRQSLSLIKNRYMFSLAWGDVSSCKSMIISSQRVFAGLNSLTVDQNSASVLSFDVLTLAAVNDQSGNVDESTLKDYIHLMRPDRDGNLNLVDFVKVGVEGMILS